MRSHHDRPMLIRDGPQGRRRTVRMRQARKETARIEEGETRLHARMAEQAADHAAVLALDEELRALVAERDELEAAELAEP